MKRVISVVLVFVISFCLFNNLVYAETCSQEADGYAVFVDEHDQKYFGVSTNTTLVDIPKVKEGYAFVSDIILDPSLFCISS